MRLLKKTTAVLLILMVAAVFTAVPAFAESVPDYSGEACVKWAEENWTNEDGDNNWTHDCVKFARLCLEAGGVPRDELRGDIGYTPGDYAAYLVDNGYADKVELTLVNNRVPVEGNEGKIAPGDLVIHTCTNPDCPKPEFHAIVISENDGTYWWKYQHSAGGGSGSHTRVTNFKCSKCGAPKEQVKLICYHIKSKENGYRNYLSKVVNVKAERYSYRKIKVSWKLLSSADQGYNVFYCNKEKRYFRLAGTVKAGKDSFIYTVTDPQRYGQEVQFYVMPRMTAKVGFGTPAVGKKSAIVSAYTTPNLPTNVTGKRLSKTKIKVTWTKGLGETGCLVEYKYAGADEYWWGGKSETGSFTISGLKSGKKVYFRLTPYCTGKGGTKYRDKSKVISVA